MHTGDKVFITPGGKYYHYKDDDCPVTAAILNGKQPAREVKETEAQAMGYTICKHCLKEWHEDKKEREFRLGCLYLFLIGFAYKVIHKFLAWLF